MALLKKYQFSLGGFDHSAGVNAIGRSPDVARTLARMKQSPSFQALRSQIQNQLARTPKFSEAEKQEHRERIAANRAKALQTPKSKRAGASANAYDFDLDSECFSGGTYDPKTKDLTLDFIGHSPKSAGSWSYSGVPARLVQRLRTGDAGEVFNEQIRDQYEA
jgi:hypothetical protein